MAGMGSNLFLATEQVEEAEEELSQAISQIRRGNMVNFLGSTYRKGKIKKIEGKR